MRSFHNETVPGGGGCCGPDAHAPPARGVLLISLGTPDEATVPAVRRYLSEFLSDPAVIRLPRGLGWFNAPLGGLIARLRAPKSTAKYRTIWTEEGSPLAGITGAQAVALESALPNGWRVFVAMRYGRPSIPDTLREIEAAGIEELVVVPMYPHFSGPTTGTAMREVYRYLERGYHGLHVATRVNWHDDHGYINSQTELLEQYAHSHGLAPDRAFLLFTLHGLPVSYVRRGDPYPTQAARTCALVGQRLGWPADRMSVAYQSRFGPAEWLSPFTDEVLGELVAAGEKRILLCPISFTADCLETLEEIDVRCRALVEEGGADMYLCPALNTSASFISAMKHLVLRGPRPMKGPVREIGSLPRSSRSGNADEHDTDSLVMIGMSMPGRIRDGRGPAIQHTDLASLRRIKRPSCEVPTLLRTILDKTDVREGLLWSTCRRFEFYGWLDGSSEDSVRDDAIAQVKRKLLPEGPEGDESFNVVVGKDALHHLLRTAAGLNSSLPGERDVLEQLSAAGRLADHAGAAGLRTQRLLARVAAVEKALRADTAWGQFEPDYCHVALQRIAEAEQIDFAPCRIVVIGGSTTSVSVMRALISGFDVPSRQLTLMYRGHKKGGQLKLLRRAIGSGRRVRVQTYGEESVSREIATADVLVFGVDASEPILDAKRLRECRGDNAKPLIIIDFNTFGSTVGLEDSDSVRLYTLPRLDAEVDACADRMCDTEPFARAVAEAEEWLAEHGLNGRRQETGALPMSASRDPTLDAAWSTTAPPEDGSGRSGCTEKTRATAQGRLS